MTQLDRREYYASRFQRRYYGDPEFRRKHLERSRIRMRQLRGIPLDAPLKPASLRSEAEPHHADDFMRCPTCDEPWPCQAFQEGRGTDLREPSREPGEEG